MYSSHLEHFTRLFSLLKPLSAWISGGCRQVGLPTVPHPCLLLVVCIIRTRTKSSGARVRQIWRRSVNFEATSPPPRNVVVECFHGIADSQTSVAAGGSSSNCAHERQPAPTVTRMRQSGQIHLLVASKNWAGIGWLCCKCSRSM